MNKKFLLAALVLGLFVGCGSPASSEGGKTSGGTGTTTTSKTTSKVTTSKTPAHNHVWVEDTTKSIPATCTTDGKKVENCTAEGCTQKTKETKIDALGHNLSAFATVGTGDTAYEAAECSRCHNKVLRKSFDSNVSGVTQGNSGYTIDYTVANYEAHADAVSVDFKIKVDADIKVLVSIGANSNHSAIALCPKDDASGATTDDRNLETLEEWKNTSRIGLKVNGVVVPVTSTKTNEQCGVGSSGFGQLELAEITLKANEETTISIYKDNPLGYRYKLGGYLQLTEVKAAA